MHLFRFQRYEWYQQLLHRDSAVLKCVAVILGVIVEVVGISHKIPIVRKYVPCADALLRQLREFGILNFKNVFLTELQVLAYLVSLT